MSEKVIHLIIKRQDTPDSPAYEQEFKIPYRENLNVIAVLMEVRRLSVDVNGKSVPPVSWEMNCLD